MNIAIDGPSGAGKSTIAKNLARILNIVYLDTGAMYRAIGLKCHNLGYEMDDEENISKILKTTKLEVVYKNSNQYMLVDGEDVSNKIREHFVSKLASDVSKLKIVREALVKMQREIAQKSDVVLDGRDIGTFVLPNADYKFYLTATVDERANRRYKQLKSKGEECNFEIIKQDIEKRDYNDMNRDFAPLKKADDAIEIDSTKMSINDVTNTMLSYINNK